jgi:hypothetical protein
MGANLITRQEYKQYMGINSSNSDGEIDTLIPKVSEFAKTYCRRSFIDYANDPITITTDGGYKNIFLTEIPVINISSVSQSTDYGQTWTKLTKYVDWIQQGDTITSLHGSGIFPVLLNGYKIQYFGGYETVPEDLKLAVMDLLTYYKDNEAAVKSTKAAGTNTTQIEYIQSNTLPAHIKRVFDLYMADYS